MTPVASSAEPSGVGVVVFLVVVLALVAIVFTGHFWWIIVAAVVVFPVLWLLRSLTGLADAVIFRKR